jgi:hypothetical protein
MYRSDARKCGSIINKKNDAPHLLSPKEVYMYNSSEDLIEKQIWIRNKLEDEQIVLLRHVSPEELPKIQDRLNALKDIVHPSIAIPKLKQYDNGEHYLEETCFEISIRQYFNQMDTTARLQLASRMCHLVESLFMLLPDEERYHGNIRLDCFSLNHENQLMLGGLGMEEDSIPDMERLDRLVIRLFDKQEHSDSAINGFLELLRDPLPTFKRPLQLRDAIRRLLVGKNVPTNPPPKPSSSGMLLKQALENIEGRPEQTLPSVDEDFELSSIDFQEINNAPADDLESLNFDDEFDLTDVPDLSTPNKSSDLDLDSMNLDEVSVLSSHPSKASLELEDFDIDEDVDLLQVPSLDSTNLEQADSVLNLEDDLNDFDINISSQEESIAENWDPNLPDAPPVTAESFEADPFAFDHATSEVVPPEMDEPSNGMSEVEIESEEEVMDDKQRKKWIRTAVIMGSIGAIAFGWSMMDNQSGSETSSPDDAETSVTKEKTSALAKKVVSKDDKEKADNQLDAPKTKAKLKSKSKKSKEKAKPPVVQQKKSKEKSSVLDTKASTQTKTTKQNNEISTSKNVGTNDSEVEEKPETDTYSYFSEPKDANQNKLNPEGSTDSLGDVDAANSAIGDNVGTETSGASSTTQSTSNTVDDDKPFVFDWDTSSNEAIEGNLNPKAVVKLMGITDQNPEEYVRANLIQLMNAQQNGEVKEIGFILQKVFRNETNKSNPIFLMASAHNNLNISRPQRALDNLVTLNQNFEKVPPQLRDAFLLERAEIRALSHLSLFYKTPEDTQRFEKTIKSFESLMKIAKEQNLTDVYSYAENEILQLENWRPVS